MKKINWIVFERQGSMEAMHKDYYLKEYGQEWLDGYLKTATIYGETQCADGRTALRRFAKKGSENEKSNLG